MICSICLSSVNFELRELISIVSLDFLSFQVLFEVFLTENFLYLVLLWVSLGMHRASRGPLFRRTKAETISVSRIYRDALLQLAVRASWKSFRPPGHSRITQNTVVSLFSLG